MPSKKKKYNARFPAGRIKKIMQTDEEVGKVAQAVPIIISRTLELFVESLLIKSVEITNKRNAKTLSPSHMKQCILSESKFDFLRDLVKNIPDASHVEEREVSQNVSADSSPNRCSDSGNISINPGPSNVTKRPKRLQKKDNGQSSDSGSDHEPLTKRATKNTYGNGRNPQKANFDEELKAFKQRIILNKVKPNADDGKSVGVANNVGAGECSSSSNTSNVNKHRLLNFYAETLPDTSEEDDKRNVPSVIQANPEYSVPGTFGFYKPTTGVKPLEISKARTNSDSCVPKLHIDLSKGFLPPPNIAPVMKDPSGSPLYHIDLSAVPISKLDGNHPYTPTVLCPSVSSSQRYAGSPKKAPPQLQTINLKRSASVPASTPTRIAEKAQSSLTSSRKNEPPLLLPINLVQKSVITPPSTGINHPPAMEIDEDYDA